MKIGDYNNEFHNVLCKIIHEIYYDYLLNMINKVILFIKNEVIPSRNNIIHFLGAAQTHIKLTKHISRLSLLAIL